MSKIMFIKNIITSTIPTLLKELNNPLWKTSPLYSTKGWI